MPSLLTLLPPSAFCSIEPQTRKLFAVARLRGLPVFTFVNKMDRPALNGFEIIEQLEKEFNLQSYPVTWPIGSGEECKLPQGVVSCYATFGMQPLMSC